MTSRTSGTSEKKWWWKRSRTDGLRDKRIFSTGCAGRSSIEGFLLLSMLTGAVEQDKMNDCYFAKKDWRLCQKEVRPSILVPCPIQLYITPLL
jgi:hypothetical protein